MRIWCISKEKHETCQYKMASIMKEALTQANDVRQAERLVPPSLRNENAEDC